MTLSLNYSKIKPLVTDNCLILTPNARTQKAIYAGQALDTALETATTPNAVRSFSQWQKELWSELSFLKVNPNLISKPVLKLWIENIISNEPDWSLTNESGVANKVVEAFQNLVAWNLNLDDIQENSLKQLSSDELFNVNQQSSLEVSYFIKWINEYKNVAYTKNIICSFEILRNLLENMDILYQKLSTQRLPKKLLLVGFNQFTPLEEMFFSKLKLLGLEVELYCYKKQCNVINVLEFDCFDDEVEFAAYTAKQIVESKKNENVAIVVNQLSVHLTDVYAAFSQVFQPEENKPWIPLTKPLYNVSAGFSIAEQPIVQACYLLLNLSKNRITLEDLHFIKNTDFIQWSNEKAMTQYFLHKLCLKGRKQYSIKFIISEIDKFEGSEFNLTKLKSRLEFLKNKPTKIDVIKNYQNIWRETLRLWGWGMDSDEHTLSTTENKICCEYLELIHTTFEMNHLFDCISEKIALQYLNQVATQKTFQLPSDRSQIHVLGVLEATGLEFDNLILIGFNSSNWPINNKPNPFLPSDLQKTLKMPGGSVEREYEYTKNLSEILMNSAEELIVTSSDENSDSTSSVSSLFSNFKLNTTSLEISSPRIIEKNKFLTPIAKYKWIANSSLTVEKERLHGGTSFLSRYANCPFSAFFVYYLKVTDFEIVESGIDARQRGVWLHDAMQLIWKKLQDNHRLLELDDGHLIELIEEKLQIKLNEIRGVLLLSVSESIIMLEKEKLTKLILEWLIIEKNRDNFKVKLLEKDVVLNLQGIDFAFRIDRIDTNDNGLLEIIDYKTGKVQVNDWFSVRPTEAQMPAYLLAFENDKISSIDYARIKKGEVAQIGLSFDVLASKSELNTDEKIVKFESSLESHLEVNLEGEGNVTSKYFKIKEKSIISEKIFDREELKKQWRKTLERIAYGMTEGFAPVSPKDVNQSCTYCECRSICRIDEIQPELINHNEIDFIDLTQGFNI